MKKKVVIILAIVICLVAVIFAVKSMSKTEVKDEGGKVVSIDSNIPEDDSDEDESSEQVTKAETEINAKDETEDNSWQGYEGEIKDKDEIVSVKIPLSFIEEEYRNNLGAYASAKGYESATLSFDKKTVTIKMRALSYDLMKINIGMQTIQAICETFKSESFPYVINLGDYDDDFSYVSLFVDEEEFKKAENKNELFGHVANCCAYYMLCDNASGNNLKIDVFSEKTGELLETRSYNKADYLG